MCVFVYHSYAVDIIVVWVSERVFETEQVGRVRVGIIIRFVHNYIE